VGTGNAKPEDAELNLLQKELEESRKREIF